MAREIIHKKNTPSLPLYDPAHIRDPQVKNVYAHLIGSLTTIVNRVPELPAFERLSQSIEASLPEISRAIETGEDLDPVTEKKMERIYADLFKEIVCDPAIQSQVQSIPRTPNDQQIWAAAQKAHKIGQTQKEVNPTPTKRENDDNIGQTTFETEEDKGLSMNLPPTPAP